MIEVKGYRKWAFPLVVIGMNSIAAYMIAHLWERFFIDSFRIHLGPNFFQMFGAGLEPLLRGMAVLLAYWADPLLDVPPQAVPAGLALILSERDYEVFRPPAGRILPAVLFVGGHVRHRAWCQVRGLAADRDVQFAGPHQHHLLVHVLMRGMRRQSGTQFRHVNLDSRSLMRRTVQNGALAILSVHLDGQVFVFEAGRRQQLFVLRHGGRSGKRGQQQVQVASCKTHRQVSSL